MRGASVAQDRVVMMTLFLLSCVLSSIMFEVRDCATGKCDPTMRALGYSRRLWVSLNYLLVTVIP